MQNNGLQITVIEEDYDQDDKALISDFDEVTKKEDKDGIPFGFVAPTAGGDAKRAKVISDNPVIVSVAKKPPKKNIVDEGDYKTDAFGKAFFDSFSRGNDLSGQDFSEINLRRADLAGGDFTKVNFSQSNLSKTSLRGAVLSGAVLKGCDLSGANLRGADLTNADLRGVDLSNADLSGANLTGAKIDGAIVANTGLMNATLDDDVREDLRKIKKAMQDIDLTKVDLSKIDLRYVDLRHVDLRGVDLSSVDLTGVNLVGVNLSGCKINPKFLDGTHAFKPGPGRRVKIARGSLAGADHATQMMVLSEREEAKKAQNKFREQILQEENQREELLQKQEAQANKDIDELLKQRQKESQENVEKLSDNLKNLISNKNPVTDQSKRPPIKNNEDNVRKDYFNSDENLYMKQRAELEKENDKKRVDELVRIAQLQNQRDNLTKVRENINQKQDEKTVEKSEKQNPLKGNVEETEEFETGAVSRKIATKSRRVKSRQKGKIRT